MSYITRFSQNVTDDPLNHTTSNLASGATFVGSPVSTLGVAAMQISFKADQNCTISVEQTHGNEAGVGTVTTDGTINLVGLNTDFERDFNVGDAIYVSGETVRTIATISSATALTVTSAFSTSVGGLSFTQYHWDVEDEYDYNVVKNNFGITVQAINAYYRIRVTNEGSATTTYIRLASTLCPIVEAVPRSLDEHGHFRTAVFGLEDVHGHPLNIDPMGDAFVCQPYRLAGTAFSSTIDTNFWTATNSGTASASGVANSIATLTSGTSNSGYGQITTVRKGRFIFANPNKFRSICRMTALTKADTTRRLGAYTVTTATPVDGFYFELSGTDVLSVNYRNNGGTVQTVSSGSFNGEVSSYTMDTNSHAYEIIYFIASAAFFIDGVLIHTFTPTTAMMSSDFSLPATFTCTNSAGGTTSATMEVWAGMILRLGRDYTSPISKYQGGAVTASVLKSGPGTLRALINGDNVGTALFYDALTATNLIASVDLTRAVGAIKMDLDFYTGLTYTTTGSPKLTVIFE